MMLVLMLLISIFYVALTLRMMRAHLQEVDQTLNRDLAANIVNDDWLIRGETINRDSFARAFGRLMAINPSIEVYLLDGAGRILSYSAPPEKVKRQSIALAPIAAFLAGAAEAPILGDDPRDSNGRKIFSVAPIRDGGALAGYLYAVLGGEQYDSVVTMLRRSYVLRLGLYTMAGGLCIVVIAGLTSFSLLTRRLRRLSMAVAAFNASGYREPIAVGEASALGGGDEIDRFAESFAAMSQRIDRQIRQLERADASRRTLMASISHDLRTPLSALQGYVETVLMKTDVLTDEQKTQYLTLALKNGQKLGHLIAELLDYSTLDTGERPLRIEAFSLSDLVQDVAQKFELRASEAGVNVMVEIPPGAALVEGDVGLIERVLDNLIDNAIKFTPSGGTIAIGLTPGSGNTNVEIRDNGIGIAEKHLPHIFTPFYRAGRRAENGPGGAGLGLAIAQRIVELHGGAITVERLADGGTLFAFALPSVAE